MDCLAHERLSVIIITVNGKHSACVCVCACVHTRVRRLTLKTWREDQERGWVGTSERRLSGAIGTAIKARVTVELSITTVEERERLRAAACPGRGWWAGCRRRRKEEGQQGGRAGSACWPLSLGLRQQQPQGPRTLRGQRSAWRLETE